MKEKGSEIIYKWACNIIVFSISIMCIYPIVYILALSLTGEAEWIEKDGFVLWPSHPTLRAYQYIIRDGSIFLNSLKFSMERTILAVTIVLCMTLITGYVVSRRILPGRKFFIIIILITIMFSGGLIPSYLVVVGTGIYNTIWALIIPGLVETFYVLVFKQFFENIPKEIEESAQIDGVGEISLMMKIIIPMSKPVMAAIALFIAVNHWNAWFDALLYIRDDNKKPLQLILQNMFTNTHLLSDLNSLTDMNPARRVSMISIKMAVAVIGTVPILCIYPFLQKYFVKGVYTGSVKG